MVLIELECLCKPVSIKRFNVWPWNRLSWRRFCKKKTNVWIVIIVQWSFRFGGVRDIRWERLSFAFLKHHWFGGENPRNVVDSQTDLSRMWSKCFVVWFLWFDLWQNLHFFDDWKLAQTNVCWTSKAELEVSFDNASISTEKPWHLTPSWLTKNEGDWWIVLRYILSSSRHKFDCCRSQKEKCGHTCVLNVVHTEVKENKEITNPNQWLFLNNLLISTHTTELHQLLLNSCLHDKPFKGPITREFTRCGFGPKKVSFVTFRGNTKQNHSGDVIEIRN